MGSPSGSTKSSALSECSRRADLRLPRFIPESVYTSTGICKAIFAVPGGPGISCDNDVQPCRLYWAKSKLLPPRFQNPDPSRQHSLPIQGRESVQNGRMMPLLQAQPDPYVPILSQTTRRLSSDVLSLPIMGFMHSID